MMTKNVKTMQSLITNKELLRRFYDEVYVQWNMNFADEVLSPRFISHDWPQDTSGGPRAFRAYYATFLKAVPDARYEVDDMVAEDDKVVVRWTMHGTYQGSFPGIDVPPTGEGITLKGVAIYRVEKGKLMERWVVSDLYGLLKEVEQPVDR
jgi:predicted ester cyclase